MSKRNWIMITGVVVIAGLFASILYLGPYLRSITDDKIISINGIAITYDCAQGNCIGFKVVPSSANGYIHEYEDRLIIPYSEDYDRDSLENNWAHLLNTPNTIICLKGYMHLYSVDTLRVIQAGYGGFRFKLLEYSEGPC